MTKVAIGMLARTVDEVVQGARIAEQHGLWAMGVADSHYLYDDCYPVITRALAATDRIRIGPFVTNCVARSWSIHASTARAHEEMFPGRGLLGLAVGDGSVYAIDRKPQRWTDLEQDIGLIRRRAPEALPIHVSASGPQGSLHAGRSADAIVIATGCDPRTIRDFVAAARAARCEAGIDQPLEAWADVMVYTCEHEADVSPTRERLKTAAIGGARFCFDRTLEGKNIPTAIAPALAAGLAMYSHQSHGVLDGSSPNEHLFDHHPEVLDYLGERMVVVGTREQVASQLSWLVSEAGLDGIWLSICWPDCLGVVSRSAEAVAQLSF